MKGYGTEREAGQEGALGQIPQMQEVLLFNFTWWGALAIMTTAVAKQYLMST